MKFTAKRDVLLEAFQAVSPFIAPRAIRPILSCVRIDAADDGLVTLTATDLEVAMRFRVAVDDVEQTGTVALPAARITAVLRETQAEDVVIESTEVGRAKLKAGRSTFQILGEVPDEFPEVPVFDPEAAFGLNRDKLVTLIRKTQFAVAREKSRFAFNGAKLHINGDEARMIATDGKRLAMKVESIDNTDGIEVGHIVPARALALFDKVLTDEDDVVRVALDDARIMMKTTRAEVSSALVDGSFPDYEAVIPKTITFSVAFNREALISALRQAALFTADQTRSVKLDVKPGVATVMGQAPDAGQAEVSIDIPEHVEGETTMAFNPDYLVEGLKAIEAENIQVGFNRPNQAVKITGEEDHTYVVMPVTLRKA